MIKNNKKIYVNGGIVIDTPFFRYNDAKCLCITPPEGCEQIECNSEINGQPCIIITETSAPSIFNEYYAKTFFSTRNEWAPFLRNSYDDCYAEYRQRITDITELSKIQCCQHTMQILLRQVYLGIIAAVDTFVCGTILTKIAGSKESFFTYFQEFILARCNDKESKQKLYALERMWDDNEMGNSEQNVFDNVLKESYSSISRIKTTYTKLFGISICDTNGDMNKHFRIRHVIAHRNGRKKDGGLYEFTLRDIDNLINDANGFVKQILDKIKMA